MRVAEAPRLRRRGSVLTRADALLEDLVGAVFTLPAAAMTARVVERALLATAVFNISLQIQNHFFLRTDVRDLGSLGGLQVSLTNLSLVWLYVMWAVRVALQRKTPLAVAHRSPGSRRLILLGAMVVVMYAASLLVAGDRELAAFEVVYIVEQFFLLFYIAKNTRSRDDVLFIVRVLVAGLIFQSLLMLAQSVGVLANVDVLGFKTEAEFGGDPRVSGNLGSPNPAAAYLSMTMVLSLSLFLGGLPRKDRWLAGIALVLSVVPLVLTGSRGGWLQLLFGAGILVVAARRRLPLRKIAGIAMVLAALVVPLRGKVLHRVSGDDNGSAESRVPMDRLALAIIEDHPLLGVGANNYALAMRHYDVHEFKGIFIYTVHNAFLLVCAETGVFGFAAFVAFLAMILREGWRAWKLDDPVVSPIALGCVAGIASLALQMNVEPARTDPYWHLMWLCGGLVVAMNRIGANGPCLDRGAVCLAARPIAASRRWDPLGGRSDVARRSRRFERRGPGVRPSAGRRQ